MNKQTTLPFALVALIAVALVGCGSEATTTDMGSLTINAVPTATVTIDGEERGQTPLEIQLAPGTHQVTLSAEGFRTIEERLDLAKGESHKAQHFLVLDSVDNDRIAEVAKELGVETAPFEAPSTHRGGDDAVFTQYWPRGKVRLEALQSFRIDVGERYGDDVPNGTLVFKKGKKVLHQIEDFDPATPITIADMPSEVVSELKPGSSFTWGLRFDERKFRKLSDEVKVKIAGKAEAAKIEKTVAKLRDKKYFKRQDSVVQDTLVAQTLENKRLYTEALLSYINIVVKNDGVTSPYRGVVTTLRRMDLDESQMFQVASQFVGGKGGRSGVNKGTKQRPDLSGAAPQDRGLAFLAPQGSARSGYNPGGAVEVDPAAVGPAAGTGGNEAAPGVQGEHDTSENPSNNPDPGAVQNNNGAGQGQGEAVETEPGKEPGKENDPAANAPNVNDPDKKDAGGTQAERTSPAQAVEQATRETQALREALEQAANSGEATAAQIQAMHQAVRDAEAALAQMQAAADQAQAGDENAQRAFDQAQADHQAAQDAAGQAIPEDPNANAGQPANRPTTMEEAVAQMIQAGNAPANSEQFLRVLRTAREHGEAAANAQQAVADAREAEANAEAAVRNLSPEATNAERNAAAQELKDAREARETAETNAQAAQQQAEASREAADKAASRHTEAAERAQQIIRGN